MMIAGPVSITMPRIRKMKTRIDITAQLEWKFDVMKFVMIDVAFVSDSTLPNAVAKAKTKARPP